MKPIVPVIKNFQNLPALDDVENTKKQLLITKENPTAEIENFTKKFQNCEAVIKLDTVKHESEADLEDFFAHGLNQSSYSFDSNCTVPILMQSYTNPSGGLDMKNLSLDIPSPEDRNGCWRKKFHYKQSSKSNNTDERLISQYFHQSGPQDSDDRKADVQWALIDLYVSIKIRDESELARFGKEDLYKECNELLKKGVSSLTLISYIKSTIQTLTDIHAEQLQNIEEILEHCKCGEQSK